METPVRRGLVWLGVSLLAAALTLAVSVPLRSGLATGQTDESVATDVGNAAVPAASADFEKAEPREVSRFVDRFEDDDLDGWTATTVGAGGIDVLDGAGPGDHRGLQISVPPDGLSAAGIRHDLDRPTGAIRVFGRFRVTEGGCDVRAPGSRGNVPFLRFFGPRGDRMISLYRVNGSCGDSEELYVAHGQEQIGTDEYIRFGEWHHLELRAVPGAPGRTLVSVYLDGTKIHQAEIAGDPIRVSAVGIHNEVPHQVGTLEVDDITVTTLDATAGTRHRARAADARRGSCDDAPDRPQRGAPPGRVVVADGFEDGLGKWLVDQRGDARIRASEDSARSDGCGLQLTVADRRGSLGRLSTAMPEDTTSARAVGWYRVRQQGRPNSNVPLLRLFGENQRIFEFHRQNDSGELWVRTVDGLNQTTHHQLNAQIGLDEWHRFEIKVQTSEGQGSYRVSMDGELIGEERGLALPLRRFDTVQLGSEHYRQQMKLDVDRVIVTAKEGA